MKKKLFLAVLALLLILCALPATQAHAETYSGTCGDHLTWTLDKDTGVLTISGTGPMDDCSYAKYVPWYYRRDSIQSVVLETGVTSIGDCAFSYCSNLTSVTIPDGVTSIGDDAFLSCTSLTDVAIPDSVTSIGEYAFYKCSSLTSVTIGKGVTSIDGYAFYNCYSMTGVYITDIAAWCGIEFKNDSSNPLSFANNLYLNNELATELAIPDGVTEIRDYTFRNCTGLTSVTIPDGVTSIGDYAFYNCSGLTTATIPDGVISIGYEAFYNCSSLTSATIPDSVTSIGDRAFSGCSGLTSVTIGKGVTSIGRYAFEYCNSLTGVYITDIAAWCDIPFEDYSANPLYYAKKLYLNNELVTELAIPAGVTEIRDYAFYNCSSLTGVTLPDGVTCIGKYAFNNCNGLISVTIPDSVTSIGEYAFYNCSSLTSADLPAHLTSIGKVAFCNCSSLTSVSIPDGVTSIGEHTFSGCTSLTSVTISASVTSIDRYAFYNCNSLSGVYITDIAAWCGIEFDEDSANPLYYAQNLYLNNELVTELALPDGITEIRSYVFCNCSSLISVTIPDGVTTIGGSAFYGCTNLKSITIPDSVTSIGRYAFYRCSSLTSVTIPDKVTRIGDSAFYGCDSLTSINIPASVTSIGGYAFCDCNSLTGVYITDIASWCGIEFQDGYANPLSCAKNLYLNNELVTELVIPDGVTEIRDYAFYNCTNLTGVTIPDGVTRIGEFAFYYCASLTSVTIPDSVTSIGYYAFYNCSSLENINIPDAITVIERNTFSGCSALTSITIPENVTSIGSQAFYNCTALTEINFNAVAMKDLQSENNVFYKAGQAGDGITVNIGAGVTKIPDHLFDPTGFYWDAPNIVSAAFADESVCESIGAWAFYACKLAGGINIPDSVTKIYGYAFWKSGLTSVTIPDSVTEIGYAAFSDCTKMTSLTIGKGVTKIGGCTFYNCAALEEVNFNATGMEDLSSSYAQVFDKAGQSGDGITVNIGTGVTKIPAYLFAYYYKSPAKIAKVIFAESSITSIGTSAFGSCGSGTDVYITDLAAWCNITLSSAGSNPLSGGGELYLDNELVNCLLIPDSVTSIGDYAFYNCGSLSSVTIGSGVTSIGKNAFYGCRALEEINFNATAMDDTNGYIFDYAGTEGEGITVHIGANVTKIPASLFRPDYSATASKIVSIKFADDSVCQSIGDYAFRYCTSLTTVILPVSTTSIGKSAFDGCQNYWHTLYKGTEAQWAEITIGSNNTYLTDAIIHYNCKGDEVQDPVQKACSVCCPHTYEVIGTTQPTCTEPGTTTYACTACGYSYTKEEVPATGHSYELTEGKAPTCTEPGAATFVCSVCGHSYTDDNIPATGHDYVGGCTVDIAPTEKTEGHLTGACVVCSAPVEATLPVLNMVDYTFTVGTTATEDTPATGRFTWNETAYGEFCFDVSLRYGDVNGDGYVDGRDVVQLRKYMANYDYDTHTSTELVYAGADVNGDGQINGQDVVLLRRYMANYDYDTGKSTIVLGP